MPTLANIAIAGAGLTTVGGLVGGGYFVFKNEERPMEHFIKNVKKRELLIETDSDNWNEALKLYIEENTKTETVEEPIDPPPKDAGDKPKTRKVTKKIVNVNDIWKLDGWNSSNIEESKLLPSFKKKCKEKYEQEKPVGIWTTEYKNFEKFCTKPAPSDD